MAACLKLTFSIKFVHAEQHTGWVRAVPQQDFLEKIVCFAPSSVIEEACASCCLSLDCMVQRLIEHANTEVGAEERLEARIR